MACIEMFSMGLVDVFRLGDLMAAQSIVYIEKFTCLVRGLPYYRSGAFYIGKQTKSIAV